MRKFNYLSLIIILSFFIASPYGLFAKEKDKKNTNRLSKVTSDPASNVVDINSITSWVGADGFHDWVVGGSWNGQYPKGSGVGAIFAEGIVWGGKVDDGQSPLIRVNGNTYGTGCESVFNPKRVYKVRPDYLTGSLADDAANFNDIALGQVSQGDIDALQAQYQKDWNEWPADQGAPYDDVNQDGVYEPDTDIPGIPGAAQTLFTKYTDALSAANYGSPQIGLEIAETYWAYAYTGALGNVIYKKVDMVYKGTSKSSANSQISDMYIVQWADPDVGVSSDDFAGCDTTLNLGYAYTAQDQDGDYPNGPPAVGYDFLQGVSEYTGNLSDSAIFNLKWRKGYKYINPKPMSSFIYFAAGGAWSDPGFNYTGTLEFYNLMRGKKPDPPYPSGESFPDGVVDVTPFGTYLLDGDPVTGTGKLDGNTAAGGDSQGDRRIMVVNGPISLGLGDTAEVVLAMVGGLGTNNTDAVDKMKKNDNTAQIVFDQLFQLPSLTPPTVHVEQLSNKIVLDWGSDLATVNKIENFSNQGYNFEGYEIYQLPTVSSAISDGVNIGTFDLINGVTTILDTVEEAGVQLAQIVVKGTDKGVQRYLTVSKDALNGNQPLKNGQEYYFAVVPYAFNPAPLLPFHALQSAVIIKVGVPQDPTPGVRYSSATGDTLLSAHSEGTGDGDAFAIVVDPSRTTGHNYKVTFQDVGGGTINWSLVDATDGSTKLSNQTNQSGNEDYKIVDGLLVKVLGPPVLGKSYSYASADPPNLSPVATAADAEYTGGRWFTGGSHGGEIFFGGVFLEPNFWGETSLTPADYKPIMLKFRPMASFTDLNGNGVYDIGEPYVVDDTTLTQKAFMYQTFSGSAYEGFYNLPFTAWDISDPANPRQLNVVVRDRDKNHQWDLHNLTDPPDTLLPNNGDQQFNYTWILNTTYDPTGTEYGDGTNGSVDFWSYDGGAGIWDGMWCMWVDDRGNGGMLAEQCTFTLVPNYVNLPSDVYAFTAPAPSSESSSLAVSDVNKVNVFPNPYYGTQARETSRDSKYVTFSHLPAQATLRIFDLSGVLVKTINKNDPTQFIRWNLQNDNNYPVASGVYVVYIDMPGVGATKVLKLALVQEEQILKVY
jgi:hypothetical protein